MLYEQSKRRNKWSYSPALSESSHVVAADFYSNWCIMGDALFCERGAFELGQLLSWQKKEKVLENSSFMPFLVHLKEEK